MNLQDFLQELHAPDALDTSNVIVFTGSTYPVLFFSLLKNYIEKNFPSRLRTIDGTSINIEHLKGELSVAFLGSNLFYWVGNLEDFETKVKKKFIQIAASYEGPHCLFLFSEKKEFNAEINKKLKLVELPHELTFEEWESFSGYFFPVKKNSIVLQRIFKKINKSLSLDTACLLAHYSSLISSATLPVFMDQWLESLIAPDKSLFLLSTYFFAKKSKSFFTLWHELKDDYPAQFWIAYWSEQIFRAANFVRLARNQKFLEAKKIGYRLPFSFIKTDWRTISAQDLAQAHNFLYEVDYRLKNGSDDFCLDLFYFNFFK